MVNQDRSRWRQFGNEARRLRELAGLTQRQLATRVDLHHTMIGSIERSTRTPKQEHADAYDAALQTGGVLRRLWQDLAAQRDVPDWFRDAAQLEQKAREIKEYCPATIPGLLQTSAYAEALVRFRLPLAASEEVGQTVAGRVNRLPSLQMTTPLLWFILRQTVLEHVVHSPAVMKGQLEHILNLAYEGNIRLQLLPRTANIASPGTPFRVLTLSDVQTVAYVEHVLGGETYDTPEQVSDLMTLFGALQAEALPPHESLRLTQQIKEKHDGEMA